MTLTFIMSLLLISSVMLRGSKPIMPHQPFAICVFRSHGCLLLFRAVVNADFCGSWFPPRLQPRRDF